jgi:hypothetical protein
MSCEEVLTPPSTGSRSLVLLSSHPNPPANKTVERLNERLKESLKERFKESFKDRNISDRGEVR